MISPITQHMNTTHKPAQNHIPISRPPVWNRPPGGARYESDATGRAEARQRRCSSRVFNRPSFVKLSTLESAAGGLDVSLFSSLATDSGSTRSSRPFNKFTIASKNCLASGPVPMRELQEGVGCPRPHRGFAAGAHVLRESPLPVLECSALRYVLFEVPPLPPDHR